MMPQAFIELKGFNSLINSLSGIERDFNDMRPVLLGHANEARNEWIRKITQMKIIDTGRYRKSIMADSPDGYMKTATVSTDVEYAPEQEFGTSKIPGRPAMQMTFFKIEHESPKITAKYISGVINQRWKK